MCVQKTPLGLCFCCASQNHSRLSFYNNQRKLCLKEFIPETIANQELGQAEFQNLLVVL